MLKSDINFKYFQIKRTPKIVATKFQQKWCSRILAVGKTPNVLLYHCWLEVVAYIFGVLMHTHTGES